MGFHSAQVFFVDPNSVGGATSVSVSAVDYYFKRKPGATNNRSGINNPGATVYIVAAPDGVPAIDNLHDCPKARAEWTAIQTSTGATIATNFRFSVPVQVQGGRYFAAVLQFDGDEDYDIWTCHAGDLLVGTTTQATGPSGPNTGKMYEFVGVVPTGGGLSTGNTGIVLSGNSSANSSFSSTGGWKPLTSTVAKFRVSIARYTVQGNSSLSDFVSANFPNTAQVHTQGPISINSTTGEVRMALPAIRTEYVTFDRSRSNPNRIRVGERCYQNTFFWPGGKANNSTVSIANGGLTITAVSNDINFGTMLAVGGRDPEWLVLTSQNHDGAGADRINVRKIVELVSNTVVKVDEPFTFSNAGCYFFKSPVAIVDAFKTARFFGRTRDLMILRASSANTSLRFSNHVISAITIGAGGTGYSNSDVLTVGGFEAVTNKIIGGFSGKANLVTNSTGGITAVYMTNTGCGFVNTSAMTTTIANSTGGASSGSGASLTYTVGTLLKTEIASSNGQNGFVANCELVNIEYGQGVVGLIVSNPAGTFYKVSHRMPYYQTDDSSTLSGKAYFCDADGQWDETPVKTGDVTYSWDLDKQRVLPSWSQELVIPYANGSSCQGKGGTTGNTTEASVTSNSSVLLVDTASNSDFASIAIAAGQSTITFSRYIINNDYTNEHTNQGNAWAKGVEVKFNLATDHSAEDLRVFATVHRPPQCNVVAYARVYNSKDSESFDDKDWTMLEVKNGGDVTTSETRVDDFVEITWGFQNCPNTANVLAGYGTSVLNQSNLNGVGTSWNTDLVAGDLVKISQPLFPNTNFMVAVVNSVTNSTQITLKTPVSNNGLVGSGLEVRKVLYPHQAFNNRLGDNVARYYSTNMSEFDTFNTVQLKLVMLSSNGMVVPLLDDVRAVGVSS